MRLWPPVDDVVCVLSAAGSDVRLELADSYQWRGKNAVVRHRAMLLLTSFQGQSVTRIALMFEASPTRVAEPIHAFNREGFACLDPQWGGGRPCQKDLFLSTPRAAVAERRIGVRTRVPFRSIVYRRRRDDDGDTRRAGWRRRLLGRVSLGRSSAAAAASITARTGALPQATRSLRSLCT